jgi:hypothetical protein
MQSLQRVAEMPPPPARLTLDEGVDLSARMQIRIDASLMKARSLAASLSYRVATRRH